MLMKTKTMRLTLMLAVLLSSVSVRADVLPSNYYSEPEAGTFYLYNVAKGQFLE